MKMAHCDNLSYFLSECKKFVFNIEQYAGDDPLRPWYDYLRWYDEKFHIDFSQETIFVDILTACLCKFENDKRYKQDRRFIKLFVKFINFQEEQNTLYEIMESNGIGTKVADLYINWAFYFDMNQEYGEADQIFRRGIDARAEPLALLQAAHTDFGYSMSQNILYKNDATFQQQQLIRMKKKLYENTTLCVTGDDSASNCASGVKSMALHSFDPVKLKQYCIPFSGAKRMDTASTQHNESLVQNLLDSARKTRQSRNVNVSRNRLKFNNCSDISTGGKVSSKTCPESQNMYEKGIQVGRNFARKNRPQEIVESRAYVDPDVGTHRNELPGYDKIMLIPATNVAFSSEELWAYRWFKRRNITNPFTVEQDRVWGIGFNVPIRCADIFPRSNFPQPEWNLPRIANYYLNDNLGPHKLMFNMAELYPEGCLEEFSVEEIMWRKRKAKQAQSQVASNSTSKLAGRRLNRTNSMETSSKLSPIVEMDLTEDIRPVLAAAVIDDKLPSRQLAMERKRMDENEFASKKRKSSIFPTFDALNDTCTTQMFHNLLHRSAISTPNAKIPKYDDDATPTTSNGVRNRVPAEEETKLKLFIDETMVMGSDNCDTKAVHPSKSNDRKHFAIYEDSMRVPLTVDPSVGNNKKNEFCNSSIVNKENVFGMENRTKLGPTKLTTVDVYCAELKHSKPSGQPFSQKNSDTVRKDQSESAKLLSIKQNQQQPVQSPTNKILFESFTVEDRKNLIKPLENVCEMFEMIAAINGPESCQKDLDNSKEMLANVLNAVANAEEQVVNQSNRSTFKEPTVNANTTTASASQLSFCSKGNDASSKTPNKSQHFDFLDTTEEFEAMEAQCALLDQSAATISIKDVNKRWEDRNKSMDKTVDKALVGLVQKSSNTVANGTQNNGRAKNEGQSKEDHKFDDVDDNAIVMEDVDDEDEDIGKSIYIPQPELKFNEKDADWHEVTVFLEKATAVEANEYKAEEIDMNETRHRIDTHMLNLKDLNPFDPELQKDVLSDIGFIDQLRNKSDCKLMHIVKPLKPKANVEIGKRKYQIRKLIGEGAYGKVFTAECAKTKQTYAFKQQRPPNLWEYYVCQEIHKRIEDKWIRNGLMSIDFAVIGNNATIYASRFAKYGTLLDVCQKIQQKTGKAIDECIIMLLVKQMITILEHFHEAKFIHADIKPDNFLLMDKLSLDYTNPDIVVQLIDFGQSIDLNYFSNHVFWAKVRTEHFVCTEMMEDKPWTFHCDYFCLASTIYTMVAGKYMIVKRNKATNSYKPQKLPRYVNANLWNDMFDKLINIPSLTKLPSLAMMKNRLDAELNAIGSKKIINAIKKFNQALD